MGEFNAFERFIARRLSVFPGLKKIVKYYFQRIMYLLAEKQASSWDGTLRPVLAVKELTFFGYYDKSPESPDQRWILLHMAPADAERSVDAAKQARVKVCLVDRISGEIAYTEESGAFNFQLGTRLQWIDRERFVFNDFDTAKNRYCAVVYHPSTGKREIMSFPVFDCTPGYSLCIDFRRLAKLAPDYGYYAHAGDEEDPDFGNVLIRIQPFSDAVSRPLLHIDQLTAGLAREDAASVNHYVNHLMIGPCGKYFIFIHRWSGSSGIRHRLMLMNVETGVLRVLNNEMTSHCCWKDRDTIVGYMQHKGQKGYFSINKNTGEIFPAFGLAPPVQSDGHPSVFENRVMFDTYPDRGRMQHIYIHQDGFTRKGLFLAPLHKEPFLRCDLHPRFGQVPGRIYIDSRHEGKRCLYLLEKE